MSDSEGNCMRILLYQIDAFADRPFSGNPAAVCPLDGWLPDDVMQAISAENNLSETAFFVPGDGGWWLRWFTPATEVDLCGHATLAAAYVIFRFLAPESKRVLFHTEKAGELAVTRDGDFLALDFPARPAQSCAAPAGLAAALGDAPGAVLAARDYLAIYDDPDHIAALAPDFAALARLDRFAVIVTAPGRGEIDFVSRFFAPAKGVDEDPVTGSAHCTLIPIGLPAWARTGSKRANFRAAAAPCPARSAATGSRSPAAPCFTCKARSRSERVTTPTIRAKVRAALEGAAWRRVIALR
jgi:PhzF family phenazine biosynthesis protein